MCVAWHKESAYLLGRVIYYWLRWMMLGVSSSTSDAQICVDQWFRINWTEPEQCPHMRLALAEAFTNWINLQTNLPTFSTSCLWSYIATSLGELSTCSMVKPTNLHGYRNCRLNVWWSRNVYLYKESCVTTETPTAIKRQCSLQLICEGSAPTMVL